MFEAPYWRENENSGNIFSYRSASKEYAIKLAEHVKTDISDMRIAIDCANGAVCSSAQKLFEMLGCDTSFIFDKPDGKNINLECGSTDMSFLCKYVKENSFDCGIAFDGDGDRCLFVDDMGCEVDGDVMLALLAEDMKERGILKNNSVVVTVLSNIGLESYCRNLGIKTLLCDVGDKNVSDMMYNEDVDLGGEGSGHIIFADNSRHGDGMFTALKMLSLIKRKGQNLSILSGRIPRVPQVMRNIRLSSDDILRVKRSGELDRICEDFGRKNISDGRCVVRASGTEPCVRVMVQKEDRYDAETMALDIEREIMRILR